MADSESSVQSSFYRNIHNKSIYLICWRKDKWKSKQFIIPTIHSEVKGASHTLNSWASPSLWSQLAALMTPDVDGGYTAHPPMHLTHAQHSTHQALLERFQGNHNMNQSKCISCPSPTSFRSVGWWKGSKTDNSQQSHGIKEACGWWLWIMGKCRSQSLRD